MDDRLMYRRELYIGGRWVHPARNERFGVVSPSTEEVVGEVPVTTNADVDRAVEAARLAVDEGPWRRMAPAERADVLARAAELLRKREADIAGVTVDEMGCAISQAPRPRPVWSPGCSTTTPS
jgi:aldehyde dehydrogenase (NAD+)